MPDARASATPDGRSLAPPGQHETETVVRPDPGLARGVFETRPVWLYVLATAIVLVAAVYALRRLGLLRVRARGAKKRP